MKALSISQTQIARIAAKFGLAGQPYPVIFARLAEEMGVRPPKDRKQGRKLAARYLLGRKEGRIGPAGQSKQAGKSKPSVSYEASDAFLLSYDWRQLRMRVLVKRGAVCECCGASAARDKARMNVDHIKPRRLFPGLALDESNLQILCDICNHGKGNWDQTDWRPEAQKPDGFIVTKDWLQTHCTVRGGWTRAQTDLLGLSWPPVRGWQSSVIGTYLTDDQRDRFERAARAVPRIAPEHRPIWG